jgi:hypothetical protein
MNSLLLDPHRLKEMQGLVRRANADLYKGGCEHDVDKLQLSDCLCKIRKALEELHQGVFTLSMYASRTIELEDFPHFEAAGVRMGEYGEPSSIKTSDDVFKAINGTTEHKECACALLDILGSDPPSFVPKHTKRLLVDSSSEDGTHTSKKSKSE